MKFEVQKIPLRKVRIDGDTQPRAEINLEIVTEYAEAMKSGEVFPPIETYFDGVNYWLADGFHRYHAAIKAGITEIDSKVGIPGTADEARWASLAANHTHGLRRNNADKRKAVEIALKMHSEMSDRALAEHCGVSQPFVGNTRAQVITVITCCEKRQVKNVVNFPPLPVPKRVGLDGKQYPPPPKLKKHLAVTAGNFPLPPPSSKPHLSPPVSLASKVIKDSIGRVIPQTLLPLWNRRGEISAMLDALSQIRCKLRNAQDDKDPLFSCCNFSATLAEIDNAYTQLKSTQPYAVCPSCQGNGACRLCGDAGFVSKFRWDTVVSKELKAAVMATIEAQK